MNIPVVDLLFVGLRGYVAAVHRESGQTVWVNGDLKSGYTTILLDDDRLIVSTNGYLYCLDPATGRIVWENPLKGLGVGVTSLASMRGQAMPLEAFAAAEAAQQAAANSSSSSATS